MKFKANIGEVVEAISTVSQTMDKRTSLPTGLMYLKAQTNGTGSIYMFTTDLTNKSLIKLSAVVEEPGKVMVPTVKLLEFLAMRPKEDDFEMDVSEATKKALTLRYKRSRAKVSYNEDFAQIEPQLALLPLDVNAIPANFQVKGGDLAEFCRRGTFCIATDSVQNQQLSGMYICQGEDGYEAQASDGRIAAQIKVKADTAGQKSTPFTLSLDSIPAVNRILGRHKDQLVDVVIRLDDKALPVEIDFRFGDAILGTKPRAVNLEQVRKVVNGIVPKYWLEVHREELRSVLTRALAFCSASGYRTVELTMKPNDIEIRAGSKGPENLKEYVEATSEDFPESLIMEVGLDYLVNITSGSNAETLKIGIISPTQPLVIEDSSNEHVYSKYVLAPMRVSAR